MATTQPIYEMLLTSADTPALARLRDDSSSADWQSDQVEGQLAVDVVDAGKDIVVVAPMAGAEISQLSVALHNDLLTIRGIRQPPAVINQESEYIYHECFWGKFSRTVVLPMDVKGELARAEMRSGILVIRIPKRKLNTTTIAVAVVEE